MEVIIKNKHYCDKKYTVNNGILQIDRFYKIDENNFKNETYDNLAEICSSLPGIIFDSTKRWSFYGDFDINDKYYLYIEFEKNNLRIVGNLEKIDFKEWEEAFHKEIIRIPFRK